MQYCLYCVCLAYTGRNSVTSCASQHTLQLYSWAVTTCQTVTFYYYVLLNGTCISEIAECTLSVQSLIKGLLRVNITVAYCYIHFMFYFIVLTGLAGRRTARVI
jgi:hypothetical protein